jgi:hypothetical protein
MATNPKKRAQELLKELGELAEAHKFKSEEVIRCYAALHECYRTAKDLQPAIHEHVKQGNEIYDRLPSSPPSQGNQNMTGLEAFDLLKAATAQLHPGSEFRVHPKDVKNLIKLKRSDLEQRDYDKSVADAVSADLFSLKLGLLGKSIGNIQLTEDMGAARLGSSD